MAKEETQICKIRELVKERNRNRNQTKAPPPKRRKLGAATYSCEPCHEELATNIAEKRKPEEAEAGPEKKRLKKSDIRDLFRRQEKVEEEKQEREEEPEKLEGVYYGETEEVEMTDWEELFRKHREETVRLEKEQEERIARAEKQEESWQLLRECIGYIKENEKAWKREVEDGLTERQKKEKKNKLKQEERKKQESDSVKQIQRKITSTWKLIPEHEQRQLMKEEETRRRMELREAKVNLWKKWRKESAEKKTETEETN